MKGKVAGRTLSGAGGVSRLIRVTQPPGDGLQSSFFFFSLEGGGCRTDKMHILYPEVTASTARLE